MCLYMCMHVGVEDIARSQTCVLESSFFLLEGILVDQLGGWWQTTSESLEAGGETQPWQLVGGGQQLLEHLSTCEPQWQVTL